MKQVRTQIINDLFNALHECNLADCDDEGYANDLPAKSASQDNLFGHIAEAIKLLEPDLYWQYCEMGYKPNPQETVTDDYHEETEHTCLACSVTGCDCESNIDHSN